MGEIMGYRYFSSFENMSIRLTIEGEVDSNQQNNRFAYDAASGNSAYIRIG